MNDAFVSRSSLIAGALWLVVVATLGAGWAVLVFAPGSWHLAAMLAGTAGTLAAVAATVTVQRFHMRTCALIRAQAEVTREVGQMRGVR